MKKNDKQNKQRTAGWILFGVYLAALAYALFLSRANMLRRALSSWTPFPEYWRTATNLTPLATIRGYLALMQRDAFLDVRSVYFRNLVGNIFLFVPMGMFLPALFQKKRALWKTVFATALIVACVEVAQLLTRTGSLDVDDLILNVAGSVIGYALFAALSAGRSQRLKRR